MKTSVVVVSVAVLLGFGGQGWALNPSTEEIIRSLRPPDTSGTRGIREVAPTDRPVSPPPGAPPLGAAPQAVAGAGTTIAPRWPARVRGQAQASKPLASPLAVNLTVQFASGSADLTAATMHTPDDLGRALTSCTLSGYRFRIEGHTDTVGAPEMNRAL